MTSLQLNEFADQVLAVMPQIMRGFARRQIDELFRGKLTLPQFLILDFLARSGTNKMKDLAVAMRVTTAAMTGTVARLVRMGYVQRIADANDRRIINVTLTVRGQELVRKISAQRRSAVLDVFGKISETDRAHYLRILKTIHGILSAQESV